MLGAVVVTKLAEWTFPKPEVCGSNLVIGKILQKYIFCELLKRRKG